jgi:general transcription factor 3C polypeptide 3 (transcription factor C subunit 4)
LEIIKCAEDRDSFSSDNDANLDVADEGKTDGNSDGNDSDGNDSDGNDSDGNDSDGKDE